MPIPFHIIDGYNLLHAAGLARRRYGPGDLERCRHRLLGWLRRHLPAAERARTTVVFDAADAPPDGPRQMTLDGITVLFAVRGGDADTEIERLIAAHSAPRQVRVVSSDHRLQKAARRRRARAFDSDAFLERLERRGPVDEAPAIDPVRAPKYGGPLASGETEHWLAVFGDAVAEADTGGEAAASVDESAPTEVRHDRPSPPSGPEPLPLTRDEVAFWQARVAELLNESVDRPHPSAENPPKGFG